GRRKAMELATVGVAVTHVPGAETRIVLGAVAPTPLRARHAEDLLRGKRLTDELIDKAAQAAVARSAERRVGKGRRLQLPSADDGIRDDLVTGVQTCALPIWAAQGDGARDRRRCGHARSRRGDTHRPWRRGADAAPRPARRRPAARQAPDR